MLDIRPLETWPIRRASDRALQGVEAVFYVAPAFLPDEAKVGKDMVDATIRARVRRFVFSSVIHPVLSGLVNHAAKALVEEAVGFRGPPTALRCGSSTGWRRIATSG